MLSRVANLFKVANKPLLCNTRSFTVSSAQGPTQSSPNEEKTSVSERLPKCKPMGTNFESLLKKPKSEESTTYNKAEYNSKYLFRFALRAWRRPYALELIQEIELFVFSKEFDEICCPTKLVCSKFSLLCLHCWLLNYRLSQTWSLSAWRMKRNLNVLLNDYIKDSVYSFQDHFDRDVYAELLRIKRTQFFALDDYFVYNYKEKPLQQIVTEDILLGEYDEDSPMVEHLENYIQSHIKYFQTLSPKDLKNNHIYWGLKSPSDPEEQEASKASNASR